MKTNQPLPSQTPPEASKVAGAGCISRFVRLLVRVFNSPYENSWRPISTAPNSLSEIVVTDSESAWVDQKIGMNGDEVAGDYYFNGHEAWEEVTHWMPLPSLPNADVHTPIPATADDETGGKG